MARGSLFLSARVLATPWLSLTNVTGQPSLTLRAGFDEGKLITLDRALEVALDVVDERPSLG